MNSFTIGTGMHVGICQVPCWE